MNDLSQIVVVMPTYNNCQTLDNVIDAVLNMGLRIIVVNDGSTDRTSQILSKRSPFQSQEVVVVEYQKNRGKGYALQQGFDAAKKLGARYAITIDSDGQHDARDIEKFVDAIAQSPDSMIIGRRTFTGVNMPKNNSFANRFSNFWFTLQTGIKLGDTQSGFRLYPLKKMGKMQLFTSRYESELEVMVRLAWRGVRFLEVPILVYYPDDRVTHFRPTIDFVRISLLNTVMTIAAFVYGYPKKLIFRLFVR